VRTFSYRLFALFYELSFKGLAFLEGGRGHIQIHLQG
jgi:hypothetical protein